MGKLYFVGFLFSSITINNDFTILSFCVISLRGQVLANNNSLTSPRGTDVPALNLESKETYIDILGVSILPLPTIFLLDFWTVPTVWYIIFLILF